MALAHCQGVGNGTKTWGLRGRRALGPYADIIGRQRCTRQSDPCKILGIGKPLRQSLVDPCSLRQIRPPQPPVFTQWQTLSVTDWDARMMRADRLFLCAFAILILAVQTLLWSPYLQSIIPHNPTSSLPEASVVMPNYTQYRSTFSCLPTPTQSSCAIHVRYNFNRVSGDHSELGILVSDYNGSLQFLLNGTPIDLHVPVAAVQRLMFGLPVLVVFPDNLLKTGDNLVEMTVRTN